MGTHEAVINMSKEGDEEAFHKLYDEYVGRVFMFIRSRVSSREDALDITQDVFVDFWKGLSRFQFENEIKLWNLILTIASRKISRFYRFRKVTASLDDIETTLPAEENLSVMDREILQTLLEKLSLRDREVVDLRYFAGLPFAEIANMLGDNESAVKVRHHRAIRKLQSFLEQI